MLFLSYAEEDSVAGRGIADWLRTHGFPCYDWLAPQQDNRVYRAHRK